SCCDCLPSPVPGLAVCIFLPAQEFVGAVSPPPGDWPGPFLDRHLDGLGCGELVVGMDSLPRYSGHRPLCVGRGRLSLWICSLAIRYIQRSPRQGKSLAAVWPV